MSIIIAIFIFSFIIFFHELGHFLLAKANHIKVIEFSMGMGPRIVSFTHGLTRYSWKVLPFGGSCQMAGEFSGMEGAYEEEEEKIEFLPGEGTFNSKNVWQRMSVVAAGPVFNFILAFLLSAILIAMVGIDKPVVSSVSEGGGAQQAGMQAGDVITEIDGKHIHLYSDIVNYISFHQQKMSSGGSLEVSWIHDGEKKTALVTPEDNGQGKYVLGIRGGKNYKVGFSELIKYSYYEVGYWITTTWNSLGMLFSGGVTLDDMAGPVGVVSAIGETYEESRQDGAFYVVANMLNIGILLTANLGVMNLLPFPALDGGRIVFLLIEAVTRRKMKPEIEGRINLAGLMFLMMLMFIIMFHDIYRIIK